MNTDIVTIRTSEGLQPIKAIRLSPFLAITKNGTYYVLTHLKTGGVIYKNPDQRAVLVFYLAVKDFDWDWDDPAVANLPNSYRELNELFSELESLTPFLSNV